MRSILLKQFGFPHIRLPFNSMSLLGIDNVAKSLQKASFSATAQPVSNKFASVLIPLYEDSEGVVQVVLTERSSKLPTHSGEVCLPGGKRDPGDADDVATALREAEEEVGIDPSSVQILARLPCVLSKHLLSVAPVVGVIPAGTRLRPQASEVAAVFTAPLHMFVDGCPGYYSRDVEWEKGIPYRLHFFPHVHRGRDYLIWGLTAGILIAVAERAFGRSAAFPVTPPGARPYTDLLWDGHKLRYRATDAAALQAVGADGAPGAATRRLTRAAAAVATAQGQLLPGAADCPAAAAQAGGAGVVLMQQQQHQAGVAMQPEGAREAVG